MNFVKAFAERLPMPLFPKRLVIVGLDADVQTMQIRKWICYSGIGIRI